MVDWHAHLLGDLGIVARNTRKSVMNVPVADALWNSKFHVMTGAQGTPVTAADGNEVTGVFQVLTDRDPVGGKPSPKRVKPDRLQADCGYESEPMRRLARWQTTTPVLAQRITGNGGGLGKRHWVAVRTMSWLHSFGRLRRRLDRQTEIQENSLRLACAVIFCDLRGNRLIFPIALISHAPRKLN
jgi:transposase